MVAQVFQPVVRLVARCGAWSREASRPAEIRLGAALLATFTYFFVLFLCLTGGVSGPAAGKEHRPSPAVLETSLPGASRLDSPRGGAQPMEPASLPVRVIRARAGAAGSTQEALLW